MPYARISRKIRPIAMMATICRPMPRRGASSVVDSRSGRPEPRAVTGSLLRKVKVPPSIAEGPEGTPRPTTAVRNPVSWLVGLGFVLAAFALYWVSNPEHYNFYNHFVWQADAYLHGRAWFPHPVLAGGDLPENWYLQDVYPLTLPDGTPDGRVLLPFPPLPAILLLPFVAVWGLATDQEAIAIGLGALGVGLAWWMLGGLRLRLTVRALTTGIFATGTVWWWASAVGSTWYLAHLVAADIALIAVGIALRRDPAAADERPGDEASPPEDEAVPEDETAPEDGAAARADGAAAGSAARRLWRSMWPLDRSQVLVGFLLGLAVTARLPLIFAAPFFVAVGGGGTRQRRLASAAVGGFLPVAMLLGYTYLTTGSLRAPGLRLPVPAGGRGILHARLQRRLVRGGPPLPAAEPADHAGGAARGGTGRAAEHPGHHRGRRRCAPGRGRSAPCSTSTAPS